MENDTKLSIRLPVNELTDLDEKATMANMSRSLFVRTAIKGESVTDMKNKSEVINAISKIAYLNSMNTDIKTKEKIKKEISQICLFSK